MTEEERRKHGDALMAKAWPKMQRSLKERRGKFLQESMEMKSNRNYVPGETKFDALHLNIVQAKGASKS